MNVVSSCVVSISLDSNDVDKAVLVVGMPHENASKRIVNALAGQEAVDLWKKLTGQKEKKE